MLKIKEWKRPLSEWYLRTFKKQHSFIYCSCGNELMSSKSKFYLTPYYGVYVYKCDKCGELSKWDLTTPVPILLEKGIITEKVE